MVGSRVLVAIALGLTPPRPISDDCIRNILPHVGWNVIIVSHYVRRLIITILNASLVLDSALIISVSRAFQFGKILCFNYIVGQAWVIRHLLLGCRSSQGIFKTMLYPERGPRPSEKGCITDPWKRFSSAAIGAGGSILSPVCFLKCQVLTADCFENTKFSLRSIVSFAEAPDYSWTSSNFFIITYINHYARLLLNI